jgi:hypothetical protein
VSRGFIGPVGSADSEWQLFLRCQGHVRASKDECGLSDSVWLSWLNLIGWYPAMLTL